MPTTDLIPARERLRVDEVAGILHCTVEHVYNLIYDGSLVAENIAREQSTRPLYRVQTASLVAFLKNRQENAR